VTGQGRAEKGVRWKDLAALLLLLLLFFAARWPFREMALIRDEGELALMGQQISEGAVPYRDIYNQKTPFAFYFMAAVHRAAGTDPAAVRVASTVYGLFTLAAVYLLTRRLFGRSAAFWGSLVFTMMTFDQCGFRHQASTEYFMLLWIASAALLWDAARRRTWLALPAGAAAGLAFLTKQTGLVLILFLIAQAILGRRFGRTRRPDSSRAAMKTAGLGLLGFAAMLGGTLIYLASRQALDAFIECTWTNNVQYVTWSHERHEGIAAFLGDVMRSAVRWDLGFWILGTVFLLYLGIRGERGRSLWLLLALLAGAALAAGNPHSHYFVPLIVPLAIGSGAAVAAMIRRIASPSTKRAARVLLALLLAAPWIQPLAHACEFLLMSRSEFTKELESLPPFGAAKEAARYLAERTERGEEIVIIGSEPEIYYLAERPPGTRLVFTYPLTGPYSYAASLRRELLDDIEKKRPRYVLVVQQESSLSRSGRGALELITQATPILDRLYVLEAVLSIETGRVLKGLPRGPCLLVCRRGKE